MPEKVDAIFELREAAEQHGRAEAALATEATPEHKDDLLDARLKLEAATTVAINSCHHCGREHVAGDCEVIPIDGRARKRA